MANISCLVVEDSPIMRQLLVFALTRLENLTVIEAEDGATGLKQINSKKFDLIITDINMPVIDGLKLVKAIRSHRAHRDVPILIITADSSPEDRDRAMALGASDYLTKPIQAPQVMAAVKRLLGI